MKFNKLLTQLSKRNRPRLAVLIDPDKFNPELVRLANNYKVSCFLVGGSLLERGDVRKTVREIKKLSQIPVVLFPGDEKQLCKEADGLFLPSLVSGRNPNYLIGKQILMAPLIKRMKLPSVPMAYLLVNGNSVSATQKVTGTEPLNLKQSSKIVDTAAASELLGFRLIYLEAGSGAKTNVPVKLIRKIKKEVKLPLIVGGGIDSVTKAKILLKSGADMLVVGNALEKNVYLLAELSACFS